MRTGRFKPIFTPKHRSAGGWQSTSQTSCEKVSVIKNFSFIMNLTVSIDFELRLRLKIAFGRIEAKAR